MSGQDTWRLREAFAHLTEDGRILPVPVGPDFWTGTVQSLPPGHLVSLMPCREDWTHWEMHPEGDEMIFQISGAMTMILEEEAGPRRIALSPGAFAIVPAGVWHTAEVSEPGEAIFITRGEATQHRPRGG